MAGEKADSSSSKKNLAGVRTTRLKNRHDPVLLKHKEDMMKLRKSESQRDKKIAEEKANESKKIDQEDNASFVNQKREFNRFYNKLKKSHLRNRNNNESDPEQSMNAAAEQVTQFLEKNYPAIPSRPTATIAAPLLAPAEVIQKLIYEPPLDVPNGREDESFTVIYENNSRFPCATVKYLEWTLGQGIVHCALKTGRRIHYLGGKQVAFTVPAGDSNIDVAPISCLVKIMKGKPLKKINYRQGDSNHCFMLSIASALHYMGKTNESRIIASRAKEFSRIGLVDQLKQLVNLLTNIAPSVIPMKKDHNLQGKTKVQFQEAAKNKQLMIVVPKAKSKSTSHAITICIGLVFDSTQEYPLILTSETLDFVAGSTGFEKVYMTRSFSVKK
jgi:hypothetical protein